VRGSSVAKIAVIAGLFCLQVAVGGNVAALAAGPAAQQASTRFSITGHLSGVAAISAGNAWAVGYSGVFNKNQKTLLLHWNGSRWTQVMTPKPVYGELDGVYATSAHDAWAVGFTSTAGGANGETLIMHWNGKRWSRSALIVPGYLMAVDDAENSVWAVGETHGPSLIMRLTGGRWYVIPAPGPPVAELRSVVVTGASTAWAAGQIGDGGSPSANLLLRWDGTAWKSAPSPMRGADRGVYGLAAGPAGTVLAVGNYVSPKTGFTTPLSMAWNGKTWRKVSVPGAVSGLGNIGSGPGGTVWAVGNASNGTAMLRWTGKAWTQVASPRVAAQDFLYGVAASSARTAWAVGTSVKSESDEAVTKTLILHWNGKTWS
jgi:hypothetical protein